MNKLLQSISHAPRNTVFVKSAIFLIFDVLYHTVTEAMKIKLFDEAFGVRTSVHNTIGILKLEETI